MSILNALNIGLSSLSATSNGISVASSNIANAQNENYNRRTIATEDEIFGGVRVSDITRYVDDGMRKQQLEAITDDGFAQKNADILADFERTLGTINGDTPLVDYIRKFESAWRDFQTTPEIDSVEREVVSAAKEILTELARLDDGLDDIENRLDREIEQTVRDLNAITTEIARLNNEIALNSSADRSISHLENLRDEQLTKLAEIVKVNTSVQASGRLYVFTDSLDLVTTQANQFTYTSSSNTLARSNLLSEEVTSRLNGGKLESLTNLNSVENTSVIDSDRSKGTVEKLRQQLDLLAFAYTDASDTRTDPSLAINGKILSNSSPLLVQANSGISAGNIAINIKTDATTHTPAIALTITDTTTYNDYQTALNAQVAAFNTANANNIHLEATYTTQGQTILSVTDLVTVNRANPTKSIEIATDTTNLFGGTQTYAPDTTPTFARAYWSAEVRNSATELTGQPSFDPTNTSGTDFSFFTKKRSDIAFGTRNIQVNSLLTTNPNPLTLKRESPNEALNALVSTSRDFQVAGLKTTQESYTGIATSFMNDILAESRRMHERATITSTINTQTTADYRNLVGVNLDEEITRLSVLQNNYTASARIISTADEMLQVLMNIKK